MAKNNSRKNKSPKRNHTVPEDINEETSLLENSITYDTDTPTSADVEHQYDSINWKQQNTNHKIKQNKLKSGNETLFESSSQSGNSDDSQGKTLIESSKKKGKWKSKDNKQQEIRDLEATGGQSPADSSSSSNTITNQPTPVPQNILLYLYLSHFLSTWNVRVLEYGAVLFLAQLVPNTFLPLSLYAFFRSLTAIVFSHKLGIYVDHTDRLTVVRGSIVYQRIAVIATCFLLWLMALLLQPTESHKGGSSLRNPSEVYSTKFNALLALLIMCACVERLCATVNMVSVERDWVVVIANGNSETLRTLNARMRRIDLLCKLLGPLAISYLDSWTKLTYLIWMLLLWNFASLFIEYISIARVYHSFANLQLPKQPYKLQRQASSSSSSSVSSSSSLSLRNTSYESEYVSFNSNIGSASPILSPPSFLVSSSAWYSFNSVVNILKEYLQSFKDWLYLHYVSPFKFYAKHSMVLVSLSMSFLYLTVLSFGPPMVSFLLFQGRSSVEVGLLRTASVIFELGTTFFAPWVIGHIGPVYAGLSFVSWQALCLSTGLNLAWPELGVHPIGALYLVVGVIFSRVGLWGFDLSVQGLIQEGVEAENRARFSAAEAACQSVFELLSFAQTMKWSTPEKFKYPALISVISTVMSAVIFAIYVVKQKNKPSLH